MPDAAPAPPPPPPQPPPLPVNPQEAVSMPAIFLMVMAVLAVATNGVWLLLKLVGSAFVHGLGGTEHGLAILGETMGVVLQIISVGIDVLVFFGAWQMKNLKTYGLAMTASIIAIAPCYWSCCVLGIPIGIWSLIVLSKPEVKAAFQK